MKYEKRGQYWIVRGRVAVLKALREGERRCADCTMKVEKYTVGKACSRHHADWQIGLCPMYAARWCGTYCSYSAEGPTDRQLTCGRMMDMGRCVRYPLTAGRCHVKNKGYGVV